MNKTIHFVSLGCAKNRVDTEIMLGVSHEGGFEHVSDPAEADVIVVNTCGFIDAAKQESIDTILEMGALRTAGSCKKLVVAGCLSQRYGDELAVEMPEVDHFLGSSDMLKLRLVLAEGGHAAKRDLIGNPAEYTMAASDPRVLSQHSHTAFLKIAEGCNRSCSFCAIPSFRGKQRSRTIEDCVAEAQRLAAMGVVELNLISQDTIAYGRELPEKRSLAELVAALAEVDSLRWIRLHYLYPEALDPALVELLSQHPKVLPYIDMPLQHASDSVLRAMRRGHGGERIYRVIERLREQLQPLVFRTSLIVGHPGETDEDFAELVKLVKWAEFDHVGVFKYSTEEGTKSAELPDPVSQAVIDARHDELMSAQHTISHRKQQALIGQELEVLVDGVSDESDLLLQGRWWGQALDVDGSVYLANGEAKAGELRRAIVQDASEYDLVADLLAPDGSHDSPDGASARRAGRVGRVGLRLVK